MILCFYAQDMFSWGQFGDIKSHGGAVWSRSQALQDAWFVPSLSHQQPLSVGRMKVSPVLAGASLVPPNSILLMVYRRDKVEGSTLGRGCS